MLTMRLRREAEWNDDLGGRRHPRPPVRWCASSPGGSGGLDGELRTERLGLRAEAIHVAKAGVGARDFGLGVTGRLSFLVLGPYDDEGGSQRGARIAEEPGAEIPAAGWLTGLLVCHSGGGKLAVCHDVHGVPFWKAIPGSAWR
jgi:hypothetical protein